MRGLVDVKIERHKPLLQAIADDLDALPGEIKFVRDPFLQWKDLILPRKHMRQPINPFDILDVNLEFRMHIVSW